MEAAVRRHHRVIAVWLFAILAMIFFMIVLGGVTRLTHSGLSMVQWKPVTGWLPPLTEAEWAEAFRRYRAFPQYNEIFPDMTLAGFKGIFWLEYLHRLAGRLLGVAFLVPLAIFALRGWLDRRLGWQLLVMLILGGGQGVLGWYMVKSGLADRPDVSAYRLTAHLAAALVIYVYMLAVALRLVWPDPHPVRNQEPGAPRRFALAVPALVFITVLSGGFVAGLDAGFAYNTFPLMDGQLVPDGLFVLEPFYINIFEDITTVQFNHRVLAMSLLATVAVFWLRARRGRLARRTRLALNTLACTAAIQVGLGISTLILVVPVALGALHQAGAVALLTAALWTAHEFRPGSRNGDIGA